MGQGIITDNNEILVDSDGSILLDPVIVPADFDVYFFGIVDYNQPRPELADFAALNRVGISSNQSPFTVNFEGVPGYLIFAEPVRVKERARWFVDAMNQGFMGGASDLFPEPVEQVYEGKLFRVYISNYTTLVSDPMQFLWL